MSLTLISWNTHIIFIKSLITYKIKGFLEFRWTKPRTAVCVAQGSTRKVIWNRYKMRLNRTNESKVMAFQSFDFGCISFDVLIYYFFSDFVYITPPVLAWYTSSRQHRWRDTRGKNDSTLVICFKWVAFR